MAVRARFVGRRALCRASGVSARRRVGGGARGARGGAAARASGSRVAGGGEESAELDGEGPEAELELEQATRLVETYQQRLASVEALRDDAEREREALAAQLAASKRNEVDANTLLAERTASLVQELEDAVKAREAAEAAVGRAVAEAEKKLEARVRKTQKKATSTALEKERSSAGKWSKRAEAAEAAAKEAMLDAEKRVTDALENAAAGVETVQSAEAAAALAMAVAAESRADAAEAQLQSQGLLLERLEQAEAEVRATSNSLAAERREVARLSGELDMQRAAAEEAIRAAAQSEAMARSAERSVSSQVEVRMRAAQTCVETADVVKRESEEHLEREQEVMRATVAAAEARASAAESQLKIQMQLLDEMAELAALKSAADAAVVEIRQKNVALEEEIDIMRTRVKLAEEISAEARSAAQESDESVEKRVESALASADERVESAEQRLAIVEETMKMRVKLAEDATLAAKEELAAAAAKRDIGNEQLAREVEALRRAAIIADDSVAMWKARAEEARSILGTLEFSEELEVNPLRAGRLRRTLNGKELRHFLAQGPRARQVVDRLRPTSGTSVKDGKSKHGGHSEWGAMNGWGRPDESKREKMW